MKRKQDEMETYKVWQKYLAHNGKTLVRHIVANILTIMCKVFLPQPV